MMGTSVGQYCIAVSDLERSVRFYTELVGLEEQGRTEIPNVDEVHLAGKSGGGRLQLAKFAETLKPQPIDHGNALWKIYMNVDDCAATWKKIVAAGYRSVTEPKRLDRWPVTVAFVLDPDGYLIELIQHDGKRPGE
jgi:lactoylglutathione lyase